MNPNSYQTLVIERSSDKFVSQTEDTDTGMTSMIDIKQPIQMPIQKSQHRRYITIILILITLFVIYHKVLKTYHFNTLFITFEDWLRELNQRSPTLVYLVICVCINLVLIFCIGTHSLVCVVAALVLEQPMVTFLVLLGSSVLGDISVFFITKKLLRNTILNKFKENDLFIVLLEESKNEPFKTAFLTRLLFIPAGIKNYILASIDNSAISYFVSGFVMHSFYVLESILIARELSEVEQLLTHSQKWSDKSVTQKASFIIVLCFILFTFGFVIVVGLWAKRKVSRRQAGPVELTLKVN